MKFTNKEKRVWKNRMLGTVATVGLMGTMLTGTGIALADDILGNNGVMNATTTARARVNLPYENAEKLVNTAGTTVVSNNTVIPSDYSFFIQFIKGKTTVETIGNGWEEYRMTITGILKKDVDYSAYMDKTGNILIPNVAKETIGTKEKATNQVQVAVQQEKPTLLPATGVRQTKESNVLPVFASASVLSLAGYFFVKGRR
ncbi:hypothetical protein DZ782_11985 [Enterococcus faecium]|nr:hypothetical protein [Enterococcus faecium]